MLTLLHNPRCSKSRQALALLEEKGTPVTIRRYLDEPLSEAELRALIDRLEGGIERLVRTRESEWQGLAADARDPEQVVQAIIAHPRLMERPIADDGERAIIGRPPEDILALLD
ncbi:arsenate reductase (glutaredoxin) [Halomonas sp. KAO]|uniref:arsenate reductase (glutaredoxin) n=1 Tax=unclassified Halomonas TaxID=2609666 RepID=UPI00189D026E|nr:MULTISPECIES: arsenate reductase (glutaredoxin) [unclassified Halomonas]MBF7052411.1 arsenate reductase (glutaredoxin) [Halomonas sp. KAO]MDT0499844.1 arsenate reductase (glutaredoxin) [Halomonas sp. PAR7]MDT0510339.1 arsenate reductase (glutaredoxin) [Halomonas sp. LES1]MDT0589952.1 arsenate reductase (glutaredoxin) [Halomonas sp. PAR8]